MRRLIAGGYAERGNGGLYPFDVDDDGFVVGEPIAHLRNVSAGVAIDGDRWAFVDEAAGEVVFVDLDDDARELARVGSGGAGPCALAIDRHAGRLAVANYEGGTTALFRLDAGMPIGAPSIHHHVGRGPIVDRQDSPHAHWCGFAANGALYVADLGADRVLVFAAARDGEIGEPTIAWTAPPGSGPRQMAFHHALPIVYLVSELASTLTVLRRESSDALIAEAIHSTLPPGVTAHTLGGAIAFDPRHGRLYVSNRGHVTIATFAVDAEGGVERIGLCDSGGQSPRFILVDGDQLLAAHEQGGGVTRLPLGEDRLPRPNEARADIPGAAFLGVTR